MKTFLKIVGVLAAWIVLGVVIWEIIPPQHLDFHNAQQNFVAAYVGITMWYVFSSIFLLLFIQVALEDYHCKTPSVVDRIMRVFLVSVMLPIALLITFLPFFIVGMGGSSETSGYIVTPLFSVPQLLIGFLDIKNRNRLNFIFSQPMAA